MLGGLLAPALGLAASWPLSAEIPTIPRWLAFGLLYLAITLIVHAGAALARRRLEKAGLDGWDRHLGFLMGAAQGCVLVAVITLLALAISTDLRERVLSTQTGSLLTLGARTLRPLLPPTASIVLAPWLELLEPLQARKA